ncbi:preprotein translocase subunit SecG [Thermodesulfobacteriota bacterium]
MSILLITIHVIVCIALIMIVLLQTGKGADMGAAFGGGSSQTLFGTTGASTFLSKATTMAAILFMLTSLALAYISSHRSGSSIMMEETVPIEQQAETPAPENTVPEAADVSQPAEPTPAE